MPPGSSFCPVRSIVQSSSVSQPQKRMAAFASSAVGSTNGPATGSESATMGSSVQPRMK